MLKQVFNILFVFSIATTSAAVENRPGWPGYQYYPELQGWLKLHPEPTDNQYARIKCHQEDALLAAAEWSSPNNFRHAIDRIMTDFNLTALHTGMRVTYSEEVYKYLNGTPTSPVDKKLVYCYTYFGKNSSSEEDCRQRYPFICYAPERDIENKEALGYKHSDQTGHFYKYNSKHVNWTAAYEACAKEGAYLAVVNSQTEAQVLRALIPGTTEYAFIGLYFWKPARSWLTVKGETIQQAGFSKWQSGEPTTGAYRGLLTRYGELYSYYYTRTAPYICEIDSDSEI